MNSSFWAGFEKRADDAMGSMAPAPKPAPASVASNSDFTQATEPTSVASTN